MSTACLCVICGLPGAGKTTLAYALRDKAQARGWRAVNVTYDELIPARSWRETEWKQLRKTVLMCLERFLHQTLPDHKMSDLAHAHSELTHSDHRLPGLADSCPELPGVCLRFEEMLQQQNVFLPHTHTNSLQPPPLVLLLDDNFYYQSMRHQILSLAKRLCMGFLQVYLQCPLEVCLHRNRTRSVSIPDDILISVCERMEPPNQTDQHTHILQSGDRLIHTDLQQLMELLEKALENPLSPDREDPQQEVDRLICSSSVLHQADQRSRRLVSDSMKRAHDAGLSSEHLKALAQHLNKQKNVFLQQLKIQNPTDPLQTVNIGNLMSAFEQRAAETLTTYLIRHTPEMQSMSDSP